MAMKTGRRGRQRERDFFVAAVFRRHVPLAAGHSAVPRVQIDGRFESEAFVAEDVGFAAMARADDVVKPTLTVQRRGSVAVKT